MDASLMVNFTGERTEKILASQVKESSNELKPTDLDTSEYPLENCSHFSIRGYVSKVRTNNRKICLPLCTLRDQIFSEKHEILSPPITVAEFKWWNCQNCLCKDSSVGNEAVIEGASDQALTKRTSCGGLFLKKDKNKRGSYWNLFRAPQTSAKWFLSENQVASRENFCEEPIIVDYASTVNEGQCQKSSLGFGTQGNDIADRIKRDAHSGEGGYDTPSNKIRLMDFTVDDTKKEKSCERRHKKSLKSLEGVYGLKATGTKEIQKKSLEVVCGSKTTGAVLRLSSRLTEGTTNTTLYNENASLLPKSSRSIQEMNDLHVDVDVPNTTDTDIFSEMNVVGRRQSNFLKMDKIPKSKKGHSLAGINSCNQKYFNKTFKGKGGWIENKDIDPSSNIECKKCEGFKRKESLMENKYLPSASLSDLSSKILQHKKTQKMRTLNDIIKSEASGINNHLLAFHGEGKRLKGCSDAKPDGLKAEITLHYHEADTVVKEKERKSIEGCDLAEMEDERYSLIHWLKKIPNTVKTSKADAESNMVELTPTHFKWRGTSSAEELLHFKSNGCESVQISNKMISEGYEQSKMTQIDVDNQSLAPEKQYTYANHRFLVENGHTNFNSKSIIYNTSRHMPVKRNVDSGLTIDERPYKKATIVANQIDGKAHKRADIIGNHSKAGDYMPKIRSKDAFCTFTEYKAGVLVENQQVSDSRIVQRNQLVSDPTVDGIPIEILELLQDNWHRRHFLNSENMGTAAKFDKDIKDSKTLNPTSTGYGTSSRLHVKPLAQCSQSKGTNIGMEIYSPATETQYAQNSFSNHLRDDIVMNGNTKEAIYRKVDHCLLQNTDKYRSGLDVNPLLHVSTGFVEPSECKEKQKTGRDFPLTNTTVNHCPQNHGLIVGNVDSCGRHVSISMKDSCRSYPSRQSTVLAGVPFGMNESRKNLPDLNQIDIPAQCTTPRRNPTKVTQAAWDLQQANCAISHIGKGKTPQSRQMKQNLRGYVCPPSNAVNGYNTGMMQPLDLYPNDNISAMHLLKLMDQAVCSGPYLCSSIDKGRLENSEVGSHGSYQQDELLFPEARARKSDAHTTSAGPLSLSPIYNQEGPSDLCFPPTPGFSGSLFSKDYTYYSKASTTPFALNGGDYNEAQYVSLGTRRKKKPKISHLASDIRANARISDSRDKNSQENVLPALDYASRSKLFQRAKMLQPDSQIADFVKPLKNSHQLVLCAVNRNPADFTVVDEHNEYMTGYDDRRVGRFWRERMQQLSLHSDQQKQQKLMQFYSRKGLLKS